MGLLSNLFNGKQRATYQAFGHASRKVKGKTLGFKVSNSRTRRSMRRHRGIFK